MTIPPSAPEIEELIARLNKYADVGGSRAWLVRDAATALESIKAENERLTKDREQILIAISLMFEDDPTPFYVLPSILRHLGIDSEISDEEIAAAKSRSAKEKKI